MADDTKLKIAVIIIYKLFIK